MQAIQQQPQAAMTVVHQQPAIISMPANARPTVAKIEKYKKIIRAISITEVVLGAASIISGAVLLGTTRRFHRFTFARIGQGMWCGVWVVIAGALGIVAGRMSSNDHKVKAHMGLAVTASVFAGTEVLLDILSCLVHFRGVNIPFLLIGILSSFSALILCIVSAAYSCKMICSCRQSYSSTQPIYCNSGNAQQPVIMQGVPGSTQGYVVQGYQAAPSQVVQQSMQPVMMVQPNLAYNLAVQQPIGGVVQYQNSNAQATYMNQEEAMQPQVKAANSGPPAYS